MAQKDANLIDESQVKAASENRFLRFFGEAVELEEKASSRELDALKDDLSVFGICREHPLDGKFTLPHAVASGKTGTRNRVELECHPGESLVFQLVLWSREKSFVLNHISCCGFSDFTCFNLEGVSFKGENFQRKIRIEPQKAVILWCGMRVGKNCSGKLTGTLRMELDSGLKEIPLTLNISGEILEDGGENDDFRMSRLFWLNSKIGQTDEIPAPYQPLRREGKTIFLKGHSVTLGDNGLPESIRSGYTGLNREITVPEKELFTKPPQIRFGNDPLSEGSLTFYEETPAAIKWNSGDLSGEINFNGTLRFRVKNGSLSGITLDFTLADAPFLLGLGVKRPCVPPESLEWHWDPSRWEDGFWAGTVNSGCIFRLTSENEMEVPLLNCYYQWSPLRSPESWNHHGKGGISLKKEGPGLYAVCYSGEREEPGRAEYHFEMRLTPFHKIDFDKHFDNRFFHPHMHSFELKEEDCFTELDFAGLRAKGVNCINVHHAISLNPIINYPYSGKSLHLLQKFVKKAHEEGFKVLLYYTVREFTVHAPEFKALYALNGEIFFPWKDNGKWPVTTPAEGPNPWFKEHLDYGFIPAWTEVIKSGPLHGIPDRSLITVPRSRMENFYLEGLRFLLERCPIDGLYLDDCDLSETGMQRLKRIFRQYRGADPILDFHAWESFNSAYCVPLRDMERFPFLSRLWLGEGVKYDLETWENWLIRLSGLPFGLTSEMLGKGNLFLGVLFGMTSRYGWGGAPEELWKLFDRFGIKDARLELDSLSGGKFGTDVPEVHISLWKKEDGSMLLAVGSWSEETKTIHLQLPETLRDLPFIQPEIPDFQQEERYVPSKGIEIPAKSGRILLWNPT